MAVEVSSKGMPRVILDVEPDRFQVTTSGRIRRTSAYLQASRD
jgi:hypothetical protein